MLAVPHPFRGIAVGGYRSFAAAPPAVLGPFDGALVVAGQNNAGKSSLLDFTAAVLPALKQGTGGDIEGCFAAADVPLGRDANQEELAYRTSICMDQRAFEASYAAAAAEAADGDEVAYTKLMGNLQAVFSSPAYTRGMQDALWFDFDLVRRKCAPKLFAVHPSLEQLQATGHVDLLKPLANSFGGKKSWKDAEACDLVIKHLFPWHLLPDAFKVTAQRKVTPRATRAKGARVTSGDGLRGELRHMQSPNREDHAVCEERYARLLRFVRDVLADGGADILVPDDTKEICIRTAGTDYLPLERLGDGLTQLVVLAAIIACNTDALILIEEPEAGLHPALQARFMRYLLADGRNQFILTTHSQAVINTAGVSVAHVEKRGGVSTCRMLDGLLQHRALLDDLGARPADILQANYVVWVEGPSDRIYVNDWLVRVDPGLVEGAHYSVVFYGGSLLSHLTAVPGGQCSQGAPAVACEESATRVDALVDLFRVNTHFCVLMDSDRPSEDAAINATKQRICDECQQVGAVAWVTHGATVENYIPAEALRQAIGQLYPGKVYERELGDPFVTPLGGTFEGCTYGPSKVQVARAVCERGYAMGEQLQASVEQLCAAIRAANGLQEASERRGV